MSLNVGEAILNRMLSDLDPRAEMEQQAVTEFLKAKRTTAEVGKSQAIASIAVLLQDAIENKLDGAIVTAYRNQLARLDKD